MSDWPRTPEPEPRRSSADDIGMFIAAVMLLGFTLACAVVMFR